MSHFLVCSGPSFLLPDSDTPRPATVVIDKVSGKIANVYHTQILEHELQLPGDVTWINVHGKVVLPGLVE